MKRRIIPHFSVEWNSMKQDLVTVRNLSTGRVGRVPRHIAEHPILGASLEEVPAGSRSRIRVTAEVRPTVYEPVETISEESSEEEGE